MSKGRDGKPLKESAEQAIVVRWFVAQYPRLWRHLQASQNGAVLSGNAAQRAIQVRRLKAMGMVVGQADLFLALPRVNSHGLYIEMKSEVGKISPEQREFLDDMSSQGYITMVANGADQAINAIKFYMKSP